MRIGVPKEIKNHEYRVAITPEGVRSLCGAGHKVTVQKNAGAVIGFSDDDYRAAGAKLVDDAAAVFDSSELIVKVKEPQPEECEMLDSRHTLFTYLHLAPDTVLTQRLLDSGCIAIAYETLSEDGRQLPLLAPMSQVAGKLATQIGAHYLQTAMGGRGVLLGGIDDVEPANVLVLGGGMVGSSAVDVAVGMGANVTLVDQSETVLQNVAGRFPAITTVQSGQQPIDALVAAADLLIGAVLVAGGAAPKVVSESMVKTMQAGSVIVDVAIDQGGCVATSHPTTHDEPVYQAHGVTHYCVGNMPSAAAWTATQALTRATLPYIACLADSGVDRALQSSAALLRALNIYRGALVNEAVAESQQRLYQSSHTVMPKP